MDIVVGAGEYFNKDFLIGPVFLPILWAIQIAAPFLAYRVAKPLKVCITYPAGYIGQEICWDALKNSDYMYLMKGPTKHFVDMMYWANLGIFGLLFLFSCFSWIKTDGRGAQKIYYRIIAWMIPLTWVLAFWTLMAAIAGGAGHTK